MDGVRKKSLLCSGQFGNIPGLLPGPDDTYVSYDLSWASASNTPFLM